jgi:hypothetical protein
MKQHFKIQLDYYPTLTKEVLDRAEFKTVWSGKRMQPGDKVVYAYVYLLNTDELKAVSFLERELDEISSKFKFVKIEDDIMPILIFKEDTKHRE